MIRISTIIPVYNSASTIARAVDSACAQTCKGQEIIVVNDGSTDGTAGILEKYGQNIITISQPNRGRAAARNAGLAIARGKYIAFLDADDEWVPHKLATQVPVLDGDPGCVLVYSDAIGVDGEGKVSLSSMQSGYTYAPTWEELCDKGTWPTVVSSWVMARSILEACGRFTESFGRHWGGEDSLLFFQARRLGSFHYVPESLVRCRVSTTIEHLRKRLEGIDRSLPARERLRQCFIGLDHYLELILNYFGSNDSANAVRHLSSHKQYLLLALALLAVHEDDRPLARSAYISLLRQAPLSIRTYLRLGWTFMPRRLSLSLSRLLPSKYQRALMGPPKNKTEWWADLS
jgi:glycosyltransferase involved in cell wall biosynthesis